MTKLRMIRYGVLLGALIAAGPLGIDMYLPAFPAIARGFGCSPALVQSSLVAYFLALAFGQLLYGPLSDRFGRRGPLCAGLALYTAAAAAIAAAPNIWWLIGLRVLQGLGGCSGTVIARSIVRDVAGGRTAARLYAMMMLVFGLAPILAPSLGALLMAGRPWTAIFVFLAAYGLVLLTAVAALVPETHPPDARIQTVARAFRSYGRLFRDRRFMLTTACGGAMQGAFFSYLAGSPYVLISLFGLSPAAYGIVFGVNSIALIGGSQVTGSLTARLGAPRLIAFTAAPAAALGTLYLALVLAHAATLSSTIAVMFLLVAAHGIIAPTATLLGLEAYPDIAGVASAVMGMSFYACGAAAGAAASALFNGTAVPTAALIAVCTALALGLSRARLRAC